ncbi:ribose-phosphate pyrophosphokinase 1, partial [Spiromyces aspiralis]
PADNIEESKSNDGLEMHISKVEDAAERIVRDFEQSVEYLRSKERENGAQGSSKGAVDQHSAESDVSATRATITEFSSTSAPTNHALPHLTDAGRASPKPEPLKRATSGTQLIHEPSYLQKPSTWHKKRASRITLVGDVRDKLVFLIDDMINKSSSFLTAAEHLKVQCGAAKIYIIAAHGLFGGTSLAEIELCPYVDKVIVTNTFPIPSELSSKSKKLVQIDVSFVLAEAIRRNHNGESISYLFERSL